MRYERRGIDATPKAPRSVRQRRITALGVALVVGIAAVFLGVNLAHGPHRVVVVQEIAKQYLAANILMQSLGSPAPSGVPSSWVLQGDLLLDASSSPHLARPERTWMSTPGRLIPLSRTEADAIVVTQRHLASSVMTGHLLSTSYQQLGQLVHDELGTRPKISSPGGGSIVTWYSITPKGNTATVDAAVKIWEQVDELVNTPVGLRIRSSINQAEIEGKATMIRIHGVWKVATLDQQPYQQAT